jgi:hypothetical protein
MKIITIILFILISSFASHNLTAQVTLPSDDFIQGWKKDDQTLHFQKDNLFDYINGGAEIFHEFGFKDLIVQSYKNGEEEIVLELYQMESSESALAIYLTRKGKENPVKDISARSTGKRYQFTILRGPYLIQVNNFSGNEMLIPTMTKLIQPVLTEIPEGNYYNIFENLPKENLVKGSERLIRGIYSLQPIFTFGEGDIFQLDGKIFGVIGDYKNENGECYSQIIIEYPDTKKSEIAFENLINNFDPYHTILSQKEDCFIFEDYQQKFGIVNRVDKKLDIKIKLNSKPNIK